MINEEGIRNKSNHILTCLNLRKNSGKNVESEHILKELVDLAMKESKEVLGEITGLGYFGKVTD